MKILSQKTKRMRTEKYSTQRHDKSIGNSKRRQKVASRAFTQNLSAFKNLLKYQD